MDYEEMLLQVTDILKAHNRHHMNAPDHKQAIEQIREIVTPKAKWVVHEDWNENCRYGCTHCGNLTNVNGKFCPHCGYKMRRSTDV